MDRQITSHHLETQYITSTKKKWTVESLRHHERSKIHWNHIIKEANNKSNRPSTKLWFITSWRPVSSTLSWFHGSYMVAISFANPLFAQRWGQVSIGAWVKSTGSTSLQEVHHSTPPVGETSGDLSGYLCESPAMGGWRLQLAKKQQFEALSHFRIWKYLC